MVTIEICSCMSVMSINCQSLSIGSSLCVDHSVAGLFMCITMTAALRGPAFWLLGQT